MALERVLRRGHLKSAMAKHDGRPPQRGLSLHEKVSSFALYSTYGQALSGALGNLGSHDSCNPLDYHLALPAPSHGHYSHAESISAFSS